MHLLTTDIHATAQAPIYRRNTVQHLFHSDTIRLTETYHATSTTTLFFNDNVLTQTLQILHKHSLCIHQVNFVYTTFMAVTHNHIVNLGRVYHKVLERDGGPMLDHLNLLTSYSITRRAARFCLILLIKYYAPISNVTNKNVAKLVDLCFVVFFSIIAFKSLIFEGGVYQIYYH